MIRKKKEKNLPDLMNEAIARELQVSIQYLWQHIMATGIKAVTVKPIFKQIAATEMKHAEMIAKRLYYLGKEPINQPQPLHVGHHLEEMLHIDVKEEEKAIILYKQIIELANEEKDYTTRTLFEKILADEEDHHDQFTNLLEK